jgi:hypothetical protein
MVSGRIYERSTYRKKSESTPRFVLLQDLVIPAGTVLSGAADQRGGPEAVEAVVGVGRDSHAWLVMSLGAVDDAPGDHVAPL